VHAPVSTRWYVSVNDAHCVFDGVLCVCVHVRGYVVAVKVVENKHSYFAERLYHSMKASVIWKNLVCRFNFFSRKRRKHLNYWH